MMPIHMALVTSKKQHIVQPIRQPRIVCATSYRGAMGCRKQEMEITRCGQNLNLGQISVVATPYNVGPPFENAFSW